MKWELVTEDFVGNQTIFGSYDNEYDAIEAEKSLYPQVVAGAIKRCFFVKSVVCPNCGEEVIIGNGSTYECDCGTLFNWRGDVLRDRDEWEE